MELGEVQFEGGARATWQLKHAEQGARAAREAGAGEPEGAEVGLHGHPFGRPPGWLRAFDPLRTVDRVSLAA